MSSSDSVQANVEHWTAWAAEYVDPGRRNWESNEPDWGIWNIPESEVGFLPDVDGKDVVEIGDGERTRIRAREMGFVFQEFNLVPTLTALENVMLACSYAGIRGGAAKEAALAALERVDLADRADHRPSELSGGEQQRVAIARAIVNRPRLVLADEPTGNLDSERAQEVLAILRRSNREHGTTIVLVTHDAEVGAACDRIVRVRDGTIRSSELVNRLEPLPVAASNGNRPELQPVG